MAAITSDEAQDWSARAKAATSASCRAIARGSGKWAMCPEARERTMLARPIRRAAVPSLVRKPASPRASWAQDVPRAIHHSRYLSLDRPLLPTWPSPALASAAAHAASRPRGRHGFHAAASCARVLPSPSHSLGRRWFLAVDGCGCAEPHSGPRLHLLAGSTAAGNAPCRPPRRGPLAQAAVPSPSLFCPGQSPRNAPARPSPAAQPHRAASKQSSTAT